MDRELKRAILKTLAYFDTFDFPLTVEEVYHWLWTYEKPVSLVVVRDGLMDLVSDGKIEQKNSFFCFIGRASIIRMRQFAIPLIEEKMRIAKKAARILRCIPFLDAVYVCNTVAGSIPHEQSDIDVFIIIQPGRLWLTRAMTTVLLSIFRYRRTQTSVHNKICLSFYVTHDHLNLEDIQSGSPDIYLAYWIDQLIPVYDPTGVMAHILKKNTWGKKWVPHAYTEERMYPSWEVKDTSFSRIVRLGLEKIIGFVGVSVLEEKARYVQKKKMDGNIHSLQDLPDSRVVVSDTMLKFHENDRRNYFRQRWIDRCFELHI